MSDINNRQREQWDFAAPKPRWRIRSFLKEMKLFNLPMPFKSTLSRRAILTGALLAASLLAFPAMDARAQAPIQPDVDMEKFMDPGPIPDNVLGQADAPYTIVEYSSMTCPHCARFHADVLPEVKKKYIDTGKAKYIIREFPLDNVAAAAFLLARCVEGDKYFDFVDLLYANQEEWAFGGNPIPTLQKFTKQVGFTEERFNQCLADEKMLQHIQSVRDKANNEFGVRATPTLFVNGKRLDGVDLEAIDKVLGGTDGKS
jgi:protein-disulfide isomerase